LTNVTREKAQRFFEKNLRGSRPINPLQRGREQINRNRPFQPSAVPPKRPFKLNQPLSQRDKMEIPTGLSRTLPTNQIPAEPRPSQGNKPQKNPKEVVERVKSAFASKPQQRKSQLQGSRRKSAHANPSLVGTAKANAKSVSRHPSRDSELQSDAPSEDNVESSVGADSDAEVSSEDQTRRKRRRLSGSLRKTVTKTVSKPEKSKTTKKSHSEDRVAFFDSHSEDSSEHQTHQ